MKTVRLHFSALFVLTCLLSLGIFLVAAATVEEKLTHVPELVFRSVPPPELGATAAIAVDRETGRVIFEHNADAPLPIASVTKLVSAAVFWLETDPFATTTISWLDVANEGRSGRLQGGQTYQNRELLFPALLESSNDAAAALERATAFTLVPAMNAFAQSSGATQTTFVDASGIGDGNVSTARDLVRLYEAVLNDAPHVIDVTTLPRYLNHVNAWQNNSPFIAMEGYQGGKHGYTLAANRTAVVRFTESTEAGEREVVYVLLGSDNLVADIETLRAYTKAVIGFE